MAHSLNKEAQICYIAALARRDEAERKQMQGPAQNEDNLPYAATRSSDLQHCPYPPVDDEISLVDLWLVLSRHKRVIAVVMIAIILAGTAAAVTSHKKYRYFTAIEIGTTVVDHAQGVETVPVDDPQTVLAKLQNSYIPLVIDQFGAKHPKATADLEIEASIPKGSQIVVLSGKGSKDQAAVYEQLMTEATNRIVKDHKRLMDVNRSRIEAQLVKAKLALDEMSDPSTLETEKKEVESQLIRARLHLDALKDPRVLAVSKSVLEAEMVKHKDNLHILKEKAKMFKGDYARLDRLKQLLEGQIARLRSEIDSALSRQLPASIGVKSAPAALTMLLVDNQIQQNRNRLGQMEERLYIDLENQRDDLDTKVATNRNDQEQEKQLIAQAQGKLEKLLLDNKREQQEQQPVIEKLAASLKKLESDQKRQIIAQRQKIDEIETRLKNMKETQAIAPLMRSPRPSGAKPLLITALSVVLGLMLGVFAAFFAEFLQRVREASQSTA